MAEEAEESYAPVELDDDISGESYAPVELDDEGYEPIELDSGEPYQDPSYLGEFKDFFATMGEQAINEPVRWWDPIGVAKGEAGVEYSDSDDFGDQVGGALAQGVSQAGISYTGGLVGAGLGAIASRGNPYGAMGGFAVGTVATAGAGFVQGVRSSLAGAQEEYRAKILNETGSEPSQQDLDDVWYQASLPTALGQGIDQALAIATAGTGKAGVLLAKAGIGKAIPEPVKELAAEGAEAVASGAKEVVQSGLFKSGVKRLGNIYKGLVRSSTLAGAAAEGAGEALEGAGQRAAIDAVASGEVDAGSIVPDTATLSRIPGELATKKALTDASVGAIAQTVIRGGANIANRMSDSAASRAEEAARLDAAAVKMDADSARAAAAAQGGDVSGAATTPADPLTPPPPEPGAADEGLGVLERVEKKELSPIDQKAIILNKVAADLEDLAVEQNEAIIPPDFADSLTIQEALKNQKNLEVEALPDGSTRVKHLSDVDSDYEAFLKDRTKRAEGMQINLNKVQKEKAVVTDADEAVGRHIQRQLDAVAKLELKADGLQDTDSAQAAEIRQQAGDLSSKITQQIEARANKAASNEETIADLTRQENILAANLKGLKLIDESGTEIDTLDAELETVSYKKGRIEEGNRRHDKRIALVEKDLADLEASLTPTLPDDVREEIEFNRELKYDEWLALNDKKDRAVANQEAARTDLDIKEQEIIDKLGGKRFNLQEGTEQPGRTIRTVRAQKKGIDRTEKNLATTVKNLQQRLNVASKRQQSRGAKVTAETEQRDVNKILDLQERLVAAETAVSNYKTEATTQREALNKQEADLDLQILQQNLEGITAQRTRLDKELGPINTQITNTENQITKLEKSLTPEVPAAKQAKIEQTLLDKKLELDTLQGKKRSIEQKNQIDLATATSREAVIRARLEQLILDPTSGKLAEGKLLLSFGERLSAAADLRNTAQAINRDRVKNSYTSIKTKPLGVDTLAAVNPTEENIKKLADPAAESFDEVKGSRNLRKVYLDRAKKNTASKFNRLFTTARDLKDMRFLYAKLENKNYVEALTQKVFYDIADFKKIATKEEFSSEVVKEALMSNQTALNDLRLPLKAQILKMRNSQDALSKELIASGAVQGDVVATIEANEGMYLHRGYRLFDVPNWVDQAVANEPVFNNAVALFKQQFPREESEIGNDEKYDNRVKGLVKLFLNDLSNAGSVMSAIDMAVQGNPKGKNLGILKGRKEIPLAIRDLMGEYTDVSNSYSQSMIKAASLLASHRTLATMRDIGFEIGLFSTDADFNKDHTVTIADEGSQTLSPLNGVKTTPEFLKALEELYAPSRMGALARLGTRLSAIAKLQATVGSVPGQARNILGWGGIFYANSYQMDYLLDPDMRTAVHQGIIDAAKTVRGVITGAESSRQNVIDYTELGMIDSLDVAEMEKMKEEYHLPNSVLAALSVYTPERVKQAANVLGKVATVAKDIYQSSDSFFKIVGFHIERARMQQDPEYANLSPKELNIEAARRVRNLTPTYELASEAVQSLRRAQFIAPFPTFHAESARTLKNSAVLGWKETKSTHAPTRALGYRRLASAITAPMMPIAITYMLNALAGNDEEEQEALRVGAPPWDQNGALLEISRNENDDPIYVNLNTINPYNAITSALTAAIVNDTISTKDAVIQTLYSLAGPYVQEDLLAGRIMDVKRNTIKGTNKKVYDPNDDLGPMSASILNHLIQPLYTPGTVPAAQRWWAAYKGETDSGGDERSLLGESVGFFGVRPNLMNRERVAKFKGSAYAASNRQASSELTTVLTSPGTIDEDRIRDAYDKYLRVKRNADEKMIRDIQALRSLRTDEKVLKEELKEAGVGVERLKFFLAEEMPPVKFTKDLTDAIKEIPGRRGEIENVIGAMITDKDFSDNE